MKNLEKKGKTRMNLPANSHFVRPYFIKELGCEGLTAHDIALCLQTRAASVLRKTRTDKWLESDWRVVQICTANNSNGLEFTSYAFETDAAKAFVAQYRNEVGRSYFRYLLACERMVDEGLPKIKAALESLKKEVDQLKAENILLKTPKKKKAEGGYMVEIVTGVRKIIDIFGEAHLEKLKTKKRLVEMSPEEFAVYSLQHKARVQAGLAASMNQILNPDDQPRRVVRKKGKRKEGKLLVLPEPKV